MFWNCLFRWKCIKFATAKSSPKCYHFLGLLHLFKKSRASKSSPIGEKSPNLVTLLTKEEKKVIEHWHLKILPQDHRVNVGECNFRKIVIVAAAALENVDQLQVRGRSSGQERVRQKFEIRRAEVDWRPPEEFQFLGGQSVLVGGNRWRRIFSSGTARLKNANNRTTHNRHQCRKTTVLSCHQATHDRFFKKLVKYGEKSL